MGLAKGSTIKKKFFISYAVIFIIMISVVMSLYYVFYSRESVKNELKVQQIVSSQMTESIQRNFDSAYKTISQFSLSPWVRRIMYMQKDPVSFAGKITPYTIYENSKQILLTETTGNLGEKIIIYFNLKDTVLTDAGEFSWKDYVSMYSLSSDETSLVDGTLLKRNNQRLIIPSCRMKMNSVMTDCLAYVQTIPLENYSGSNASVIFFIPVERIAQQSYSYFPNNNVSIELVHGGKSMLPLGTRTNPVNLPENTLAELAGKADEGEQMLYIPGEKKYVYYQKLAGVDLASLVSIPAADIRSHSMQILQVFLGLFAMMLVFILFISYKMSLSYYRPIEKIIKGISIELKDVDLTAGMSDNEYRMIETAFRSLSEQNKELNMVIFRQNPLIQRYILQKILEGEGTAADGGVQEGGMQEYLDILSRYSYMNCLIIARTAHYKQVRMELLKGLEHAPALVFLDVEMQDKLVIIVNYEAPPVFSALLEEIWAVLGELEAEDCFVGIGRETTDVRHLFDTYTEACRALSYSYMIRDHRMLYAEEFTGREHNKSAVRAADESRLIQALGQGDAKEVLSAVQDILADNIMERKITPEELFALIEKLNRKIARFLEEQFPDLPHKLALEARDFLSLDHYLLAYYYRVKKICHAIHAESSGHNTVNNAIVTYIHDHLTDTELSLQKMADYLGYTQTYLSRYFKEQFDCNYYDYVVKKRLGLAMEALSNQSCSINDIAVMSGFANDATFRRVFKSNIGMTPVQYRRQALMKKSENKEA